jgi:hypothetical protein
MRQLDAGDRKDIPVRHAATMQPLARGRQDPRWPPPYK